MWEEQLSECLFRQSSKQYLPMARSLISLVLTSLVSCNNLMTWDSSFFILQNQVIFLKLTLWLLHFCFYCISKTKTSSESSTLQDQVISSQYTPALSKHSLVKHLLQINFGPNFSIRYFNGLQYHLSKGWSVPTHVLSVGNLLWFRASPLHCSSLKSSCSAVAIYLCWHIHFFWPNSRKFKMHTLPRKLIYSMSPAMSALTNSVLLE